MATEIINCKRCGRNFATRNEFMIVPPHACKLGGKLDGIHQERAVPRLIKHGVQIYEVIRRG